jgi:hypothetical protein
MIAQTLNRFNEALDSFNGNKNIKNGVPNINNPENFFKKGSCVDLENKGYINCNKDFYDQYKKQEKRDNDGKVTEIVKNTPETKVVMYIVQKPSAFFKNPLVTTTKYKERPENDCLLVRVNKFESDNQGYKNALEQEFIFTIGGEDGEDGEDDNVHNGTKIRILASEITDIKHNTVNTNEIKYLLYCKKTPVNPVKTGGHYRKSKKRKSKKSKKRSLRSHKTRKH